jgi:teichuronic acid biosynthesis glycosyltransferase TuaG
MYNSAEVKKVPAVTVIMPAYNAERFIGQAIGSVQAQTFTDWQLLVIDDGSRDGTCDVVQALAEQDSRICLLRNEQNMGVAKTRNRGFDLCKSPYVALLDSDDLWHPGKLQRQLELMAQSGAEICYCSYGIVGADGNRAKPDYLVPEQVGFKKLLKENVIGCSTVVLASRLLEKYRFETSLHHEDYALWLRMLRDGCAAAGCREVLANWRLIENSRSFDKRKSACSRWEIYRNYMGLPLGQSLWAFGHYAFSSVKKYFLPG